jgi:serine/threonine protein kinase
MTSEPRSAELVGALLGSYRLLERIGEGGMGVVYVGRHEALGHLVAVKVLQHELSRHAEMVRRFFNEAQAAGAIRSPGIVRIFDFGITADGSAYFVMELLEGQSLAARLSQRRLDHAECCRIGRQIANVLQAAHAAGITHRDLKPDNLFLVPDAEVAGGERVKVLDFGIAKMLDGGNAGDGRVTEVKTRAGLVMGTPQYMSPEQCRGAGEVDTRSDIYALGCILFEMVCGRPPFVGAGMGEVIGAHQYVDPPAPRSLAPDAPEPLAGLILHMLAKRPEARPQPMAAVGQALDEILRMVDGGAAPRHASMQTPIPSGLPTPTGSGGWPAPTGSGARPAPTGSGARPAPTGSGARPAPTAPGGLPAPTTLGGSAAAMYAAPRPPTRRLPYVLGALGATVLAIGIVVGVRSAGAPGSEPATKRDLEVECLHDQYVQAWSELDACADRLAAASPALAKELKARATLELEAAPRIGAFEAALRAKDLKTAKAALDALAGVTRFVKLKRSYDDAEDEAIGDLVERLARAKADDCKAYDQLVAEARQGAPPRVVDEAVRRAPCTPVTPATAPAAPAAPGNR